MLTPTPGTQGFGTKVRQKHPSRPGRSGFNPAKITRPVPGEAMARPRLFRRLDQARRRPVVWLSSPAGAGKTTLVSSYLDARQLPCLWYQVDEGDADPATFFHYLGLAGRKAAPRRKRPLPHLTAEYLMGVPAFARRFFEDLGGRLPAPSLIVLDNFQEVPATSPLHAALAAGFLALPKGVDVIVLSREAMPQAFARLRANGMIAEIGWQALRLTEAESRRLWRLHAGRAPSRQASESLLAQTAGWAAGQVLLSRRGEPVEVPVELASGSEAGELFDYFAGEIFDTADPETRDFLLKTALLPSMTADMAASLSGNPAASRLLQSLYRRNFFTERRPGRVSEYQYHPLFRVFLLSRGREAFHGAAAARLRVSAARLLLQHQRFDEAAELLIEAEDWPTLAELAIDQAPMLTRQGRCSVLEAWFARLPEALAEGKPWIHYWLGVCRLPFDQRASGELFQRALEAFGRDDDRAGIFLAWSGIADSMLLGFEDFSRLDAWIARLGEIIQTFGPPPAGEIEARVASSMYAALVHRQPDHPDFAQWEARALVCTGDNATARAQALLLHLCAKIDSGDLAAIEHAGEAVASLERSAGAPPLARLTALVARVMYWNFMARPDDCLATAAKGMALASETGVHVMDFMLLGNGVACALGNEDEKAADELLGKMTGLVAMARPWDRSFHEFLLGWHAFLQGELAGAGQHVDAALKLTRQTGVSFSITATRILEAHVLFARGKTDEAVARIDRLLGESASPQGNPFWNYVGLLAQAEFLLQRNREAALDRLREAMAIGNRKGYFHGFFFWRSQPMAELCAVALEAGIEVDYVRWLVRRRELVPESPPLHIQHWPWPVKIYTLGRFGILKDDAPLEFSGKGRHKQLEMLKLLTALGGRDVREERISDFLWPDADGDAAHSNFKTTLSRLRKWLGNDEAIEFRDGHLSLNDRRCWVDAWAFERAMSEAEARTVCNGNALRVEAALALYHGPFLAEENADWVLSPRERLRRRYLQGLLELGLYHERAGQWQAATDCYRRGLQVEDLAEELYQRLMACYARLGLRAEALVTFEQCRQALRNAFDVEPSTRTLALLHDIREGREPAGGA